jgi:UDP-glucuronate 4-epimerase
VFKAHGIKTVVNLAAQAGVRYSLTHPDTYVQSNIQGFLNILEACRHHQVTNLIYASSSSVYGLNQTMPFSEDHNIDHPISLYAASKKANELMAHTYAHLFDVPTTGLRFFTVYGPWGRPDMAMFLFATAILDGSPIRLFRGGDMLRDFTYIDDIVESIVRLTGRPATPDRAWDPAHPVPCTSSAPYRIFNIGNHSPILVKDLLEKMEGILGKKAIINAEPMQPGDVPATFAAVDRLAAAVDFAPRTPIDQGLKLFLEWLLWYRKQNGKST